MFVVAWGDAVLGAAKISNVSEPIIKTTLIFMLALDRNCLPFCAAIVSSFVR